jgi:hypothetical protein
MVVKFARILSATLVLALMAEVRPAAGWSLNPFATETKTTTVHKPAAKSEPSTLDKIGSGTKSLVNKTGETLGLKKPEPKRPTVAYARPQTIKPKKKPQSSSWLPSFMQSEEPKKDKNVSDWMSNNKRPEVE